MMRMLARLVPALVLVNSPAWFAQLTAAAPTPGHWMLSSSDGGPVLILELRKNPHAKGGWAGALIRPKHFSADPNFTSFSNIEGPAVAEPIVAAAAHADELDLTVRDSSSDLTKLVWKPSGSGGSLEFKDSGTSPAMLVPAPASARVASTWNKGRTYTAAIIATDNPRMTAIFDADQADRGDLASIDWSVVGPRDEARRTRTKALLDSGKLQTGTDFYHAAFVFQHGYKPADFLLAHTLAVIAAARGRSDATWIAAATLDRYLMNIGQKQIYGTQFITPNGGTTTQEPYDRSLVSDALRQALGVPPMNAQEQRRKEIDGEMKAGKSRP
jgi:hypothetical protein